jgi:hypothetical protein
MRSHEEIAATARPGRAFSNSTEWEIWKFNVCMGADRPGRACVNDANDDCPLIAEAICGDVTPAEWSGPHGRYRCSEKTTAAELRAREKAEQRAHVEESHYPMFDTGVDGS